MKTPRTETITITATAGGGQAIGQLADGRVCFVWGALPGEVVQVRLTKQKSRYAEAIVTDVHTASPQRTTPVDPDSYLSTSPWQCMTPQAEQHYKAQLIADAFRLHHLDLAPATVVGDGVDYGYRNKVEFSWYGDSLATTGAMIDDTGVVEAIETLDLAFFRRGTKGKLPVNHTSLARPEINQLAQAIRDLLRTKPITARQLRSLLIRCDQQGSCVWQLYVKDDQPTLITADQASRLPAQGGEIIYSDPKSPASRITRRLSRFGQTTLTDKILGIEFHYAAESFFQINLPVYELALRQMANWVQTPQVLDLYAGVGSIGLTIGGTQPILVEINADAVREMRRNIASLDSRASAVLAASEQVLEQIQPQQTVIVDPPRAGLHHRVVERLLAVRPPRIIYLSCNPATQARDVALLTKGYRLAEARGYNFFPRTPHIEHLVVLDALS